MTHHLEVILKDKSTTISPFGIIYNDEYIKISTYLQSLGKTWEDINHKTAVYYVGTVVPYKCGNKFSMHKGSVSMINYIIAFSFVGESEPVKQSTPNKKYGKR